ncbi:MAG: GalNAc5-diNAcBac-PP-undecaprenol beta-1,3-glucosyltransferase [Saprospiraceae bacterium]|jgi:GalNAc5-diNAcBac-PP-undecaprenol beta-1,3-glucosyltransferase
MKEKTPLISLLILTYNRAHLLARTIDSVLNQSFQNFEIILINNGSEDHTKKIIEEYQANEKFRIFHLEKNIGFAKGFNFGLEQISGEWFAFLGDDDVIDGKAFETLLQVLTEVSPDINAINCNGIDSATGRLSGTGLDRDQYLPIDVIVEKTGGNFWGITKNELIGDIRLNEKIPGLEDTFWYQIDAIANRYYIHKKLIIYYTDHGKTETSRQSTIAMKSKMYEELLHEPFFWDVLRKYNQKQYLTRCLKGMCYLKLIGKNKGVQTYRRMAGMVDLRLKERILVNIFISFPPPFLEKLHQIYKALSPSW